MLPDETLLERANRLDAEVKSLKSAKASADRELSGLALSAEASLRRLIEALPTDPEVLRHAHQAAQCFVRIRSMCGLPAKLVSGAGRLTLVKPADVRQLTRDHARELAELGDVHDQDGDFVEPNEGASVATTTPSTSQEPANDYVR